MGYTTNFTGSFAVTPPLKPDDREFLTKLARTRRMKRVANAKYGVEGEFFVDEKDDSDYSPDIIDRNQPPSTQPSLWCQWEPNEDGTEIQWDGGEKFYEYVAWIKYIVDKILTPRGYKLNGDVQWEGEDPDDLGQLIVKDNQVYTRPGWTEVNYGDLEKV